jgi:hypothetical protein
MKKKVTRLASLRYSHRMRLVQALAERLREQITTEEGDLQGNVLEVGCGAKTRGGEFLEGRPPCVKILVRKKIPGYEHALEPEIKLRHGRKTYHVLTDVDEFDPDKFHLQASIDKAAEIRAGQVGSLGFVMQDTGPDRYVVSAAHVLQSAIAAWRKGKRSGSGDVLADFGYRPGPSGDGVFDAMPAKVTSLGPIAPPPDIPYGDSIATWPGVLQVGKVVICGKRGLVPATVAFRVPTLPAHRPLERVLMCRLVDGFPTADGDSGAPILTQSGGRLVGIHIGIYPDPSTSPAPYYSVGHVAGDLLDHFSALMQKTLHLWRP